MQSFLANFSFFCPNLKSIAINPGRSHQVIPHTTIEILSRAIVHHQHLERLNVSVPIDDVALVHVALSESLKTLALVLHPEESNLHQVFIPSDTIPFRYIEDLSLDVWDLRFVTSLLRTQDQKFCSFVLYHYSPPTIEAVNALFTALASRQRAHSVQSITLAPDPLVALNEVDEFDTQLYVSYETFRPLSSFCHLRRLVIDCTHWFSFDDDELISLARNWPLLQVLRLDCERSLDVCPWESKKYITLRGLLSLLECCPDLRKLCIPLDATKVPTDREHVVCNPALTSLEFPQSPINDASLVQHFFARHFPSVSRVRAFFNQDPEETLEYSLSWYKVDAYLRRIHQDS